MTNLQCPECGGPLSYMGALGSMLYFRCRNCNIEVHEAATDDYEEETV